MVHGKEMDCTNGHSVRSGLGRGGSTTGGNAIPDFIRKLHGLLEDERHSDVISWSASDDSFIVKDQGRFSRSILPMYFKHSNFASFVRQLNKYDFHKVKRTSNEYITAYGEQIWEFRHPLFLRRRYDLLESIRRKCVTKTRAKSDSATPGPDTNKAEASITTGDAPENAQQVSELFNQIAELRTQLKEVTRMERQNALNVQKYARSYAQLKTEMDMVHDQIHQRDRIISQLIQCLASQDMLNKDIGAHAAPSQLLSSYVKLMRQDTSRTTPSDHLASPTSRPKMEDPGMVFSTGASASQQLSSSSALSVPGSENQTGAPVSVATTSSVACSVPNPHASSQSHPSFMAPFQSISPSLIPCRQSELTQSVKLLGQYVNNMPAMPVSSAASSDAPTTTAVTTDSTSPALSFTSTITVVPSNIPSPSSSPSVTATGAAPNGSHSRQDYFCDAAKGLAFTWMQPPRVLLVEDAAVSQLTTKHMLQSLGCVFDEVADDVAAINKLNTSKYDLVLMDISLPQLDGVGVIARIRQFDQLTPIVGIVSDITQNVRFFYLSCGMTDMLLRPFSEQSLRDMLEKYCAHLVSRDAINVPCSISTVQASGSTTPASSTSMVSTLAYGLPTPTGTVNMMHKQVHSTDALPNLASHQSGHDSSNMTAIMLNMSTPMTSLGESSVGASTAAVAVTMAASKQDIHLGIPAVTMSVPTNTPLFGIKRPIIDLSQDHVVSSAMSRNGIYATDTPAKRGRFANIL